MFFSAAVMQHINQKLFSPSPISAWPAGTGIKLLQAKRNTQPLLAKAVHALLFCHLAIIQKVYSIMQ